jgi:hypothetical protein
MIRIKLIAFYFLMGIASIFNPVYGLEMISAAQEGQALITKKKFLSRTKRTNYE